MTRKILLTVVFRQIALIAMIFASLWGLIEAFSFFEIITSLDKSKKNLFFGVLVAFTILLSIIVNLGNKYILKVDNDIQTIRLKIGTDIFSIKKTINAIARNDNYYKLLLIEWRLEQERDKFEKIYGGEWTIRDIKSYEYFRFIFGKIIQRLSKPDEYLTLSNLNFWESSESSTRSFLEDNLTAVNTRNVSIKRVIILNSKWFEEPVTYKNKINSIKKIANIFEIERSTNPEKFRIIDISFYISKNYEHEARTPVPYAIVRNKDKNNYMTILPEFPDNLSDNNYPILKFNFYKSQTTFDYQDYLKRFENISKKSNDKYSIKEFYDYIMNNDF